MTHRRPLTLLGGAAALPLVTLVAAGCGGGGGSATAASLAPKTASGHAATVGAANEGSLGKILVDSQGHTLYLFKKDSGGTKSACSGACATNWPPLRATGKPTVAGGSSASKVGTSTRSDGAPQVTYNGHPLYRFVGDKKPGDTNGQGLSAFGGGWFALSATGNQVSGQGSASSSSSAGAGGY